MKYILYHNKELSAMDKYYVALTSSNLILPWNVYLRAHQRTMNLLSTPIADKME